MHLTIHPIAWFHHEQREGAHAEKWHWRRLFQNETFWVFVVVLAFLVVTVVLTMLFGGSPTSLPSLPIYP